MLFATRDTILWFVWSEVMEGRLTQSTKACAGAVPFPVPLVVIYLANSFLSDK